jgi:molybdopterin molybdotransferase
MITIEKARETILTRISPLEPEKVYIEDALERYLAEDIISDRDIPSWDNSSMDGYAVHRKDIPDNGARLEIAYEIPAGAMPQGPFPDNTAVKLMTGAPVPPGADAVVKRADTDESPSDVLVNRKPALHENIRFRGEDIKKGDLLLKSGIHIDPSHIGVLASIRRYMDLCRQRPGVAIMATGDEIADMDDELTGNKISSSNSYTLKSLVRQSGAIPVYLGVAKDTKQDLTEKLEGQQG